MFLRPSARPGRHKLDWDGIKADNMETHRQRHSSGITACHELHMPEGPVELIGLGPLWALGL